MNAIFILLIVLAVLVLWVLFLRGQRRRQLEAQRQQRGNDWEKQEREGGGS